MTISMEICDMRDMAAYQGCSGDVLLESHQLPVGGQLEGLLGLDAAVVVEPVPLLRHLQGRILLAVPLVGASTCKYKHINVEHTPNYKSSGYLASRTTNSSPCEGHEALSTFPPPPSGSQPQPSVRMSESSIILYLLSIGISPQISSVFAVFLWHHGAFTWSAKQVT